MSAVFEIIAEMSFEFPPERIKSAIGKLEHLHTRGVSSDNAKSIWGNYADKPLVGRFADAAAASGISPDELCAALLSALTTAENVRKSGSIDILWTGPQSKAVPVRRTEQALCEVLDSAKSDVFIVSFVAYKAEKVYEAVRRAICRGVRVSFLTEASKENGGTLDVDPVKGLRKKFPEATFYQWMSADGSTTAVVHAKCAVADGRIALITSANLTGAAMDNNMELGLLLTGYDVAKRLKDHFVALTIENIIKKV